MSYVSPARETLSEEIKSMEIDDNNSLKMQRKNLRESVMEQYYDQQLNFSAQFTSSVEQYKKRKQEQFEEKQAKFLNRLTQLSEENEHFVSKITHTIAETETLSSGKAHKIFKKWSDKVYSPIKDQVQQSVDSFRANEAMKKKREAYDQFIRVGNTRRIFLDCVDERDYDPFESHSEIIRYKPPLMKDDPLEGSSAAQEVEKSISSLSKGGYEHSYGSADPSYTVSQATQRSIRSTTPTHFLHTSPSKSLLKNSPEQTLSPPHVTNRSFSTTSSHSSAARHHLPPLSLASSQPPLSSPYTTRTHSSLMETLPSVVPTTRRTISSLSSFSPVRTTRSTLHTTLSKQTTSPSFNLNSTEKSQLKVDDEAPLFSSFHTSRYSGKMGKRFDVDPRVWSRIDGSSLDDRRLPTERKRRDPNVQRKFKSDIVFDEFSAPPSNGQLTSGRIQSKRIIDPEKKDNVVLA
eukprot:MONOS_6448.1-p1 / transcript=MONOS_6448.1 / gene=MONOS_6448 / organism=Monocercomonoides_exilis_PA203 / gene_product=unspecified product / transcript_product=unspecified product / location=Mono_scaffold00203:2630-4190(-) / protein_length=461 / sequence_SO=supercontig / SO=protein_coding / is_pseudo=false